MRPYLRATVFCAVLGASVAAASPVNAQEWFSPIYSLVEEGEILDIALENESGDAIETRTFADTGEQIFYVQVKKDVDTSALVPELEVTDGYEIEAEPGVSRDFSEPVTFTLSNDKSPRSFKWRVKVFDADTGMIFNSDTFSDWQPIEKHFEPGKLDNSEGLHFESSAGVPAGSWALFYYDNPKPVVRIAWKSNRNEHQDIMTEQLLDLSSVPSSALEESKGTDRGISESGTVVRWRTTPAGTSARRISRVDLSDAPVEGPIALRYKKTDSKEQTYWMRVEKVMLRFSSN